MNYSFNIKNNKLIRYKNKGMSFEKEISESNRFYYENNIAFISKRPTPIKIIKTKDNIITEAKFCETAFLDFEGVYKGKYIAIEAKETEEYTNFPLNNISQIQIDHIKKLVSLNALVFLFINFINLNRYFLLDGKTLIKFINENIRKSIPLSYLILNSIEVKRGLNPPLDYLKYL